MSRKKKKAILPGVVFIDRRRSPRGETPHPAPVPELDVGHPFGRIVTRRLDRYVVWEFYLYPLLDRFRLAGKSLHDLQEQVFRILETRTPWATRNVIYTLPELSRFAVFPGGSESTFVVVAYFTCQKWAEIFVYGELYDTILPDIERALVADLERRPSGPG